VHFCKATEAPNSPQQLGNFDYVKRSKLYSSVTGCKESATDRYNDLFDPKTTPSCTHVTSSYAEQRDNEKTVLTPAYDGAVAAVDAVSSAQSPPIDDGILQSVDTV